jgi:serine phosphatase RsbU (regulator of sigma subunit)/PAS domain-containing protein/anti-sigma regulatory factor (Ser/Thr protein kinase)
MTRLRPLFAHHRDSDGPDTRGRSGGGLRLLSVHSVVGQLFLLQIVLVVLIAIGAVVLLVFTVRHESSREAANRSYSVAESLAHSPGMRQAMQSRDPTAQLQQRTTTIAHKTGVDFVLVVNREGVRYASSTPGLTGTRAAQDMAPLLAGHTVRVKGTGDLGPQYRAFVPVDDGSGRVLGAVGAGITAHSVADSVNRQLPALLGGAGAAVAVSTAAAALLSRRLLRQTRGLGPSEITRLYEHHDAVLHAAKEGVLITDAQGRLLLANDEAQRLLELPQEAEGRQVDALGLPPPIADLLASEREATDEVHLAGGRVLAFNQRLIDRRGGPAGNVATVRDSTELRAMSGRAEAASGRLKLLYDASVGIGTTLDVSRTAKELAEVSVPQFADFVTVDLVEPVLRGEEPGSTSTRLRRTATAGVVQDNPLFPTGATIPLTSAAPQIRSLLSGRAVWEPDLKEARAWWDQDTVRAERVVSFGIRSLVTAPLAARGTVLGVATFWRGADSEPFEEDDLALAEEVSGRAAVCIDNARRYTREHSMAVTLQRSLLPSGLPDQSALDIAYRYLPAQKSVGGDWFDVIPLPGARVALVVGDVVGHGLRAAVTMGRLRTAVYVYASLDLPPDEILAHLDELADRIDRGEGDAPDDAIVGATCLYAVYDPVDGRCSMARAGHMPPALRGPDGSVEYLDIPAGPPLGAGGLPFETREIVVPEGSTLVLYTDGLVEERNRDIDVGLELLRQTLAGAPEEPEAMCGTVMETLVPEGSPDDTALLVARTRVLPEDRVARWEVPPDPAAVGALRVGVAEWLGARGLGDSLFTTELIVTELVTNAIRHAAGPIAVRLMVDQRLICEVSDGSSTSPHLGTAAATDEGGRGLFLVARLSDQWGTRYTRDGKIIWSEQALPAGFAATPAGEGPGDAG